MSDQERPIEPSDAERAEVDQAVAAYVEWLETAVDELDFLHNEGGPDSVAALEDENKDLRAQLAQALTEANRTIEKIAKARASMLPRLDNCGQYLAKNNRGQWHYLNHAQQWCSYQGPCDEARAAALRSVTEIAEAHITDARDSEYHKGTNAAFRLICGRVASMIDTPDPANG